MEIWLYSLHYLKTAVLITAIKKDLRSASCVMTITTVACTITVNYAYSNIALQAW